MALWSRKLQLDVARANRILNEAFRRQRFAKVKSSEEKTALSFSQKELEKIYGRGAKKFRLSGIKSQKTIERIQRAVENVLGRSALTIKGRKEVENRRKEGFFRGSGMDKKTKDKIWDYLINSDSPLLKKAEELGYKYDEIIDAFHNLTSGGMSVKNAGDAMLDYIEHGELQNATLQSYLQTEYPEYFTGS